MRKLIVGNWKMNGTSRDVSEIMAIAELSGMHAAVDAALCLPATLIYRASQAVGGFAIGGQDCHMMEAGAYTGCLSAEMLSDAGAVLTIIGHSERRAAQHEQDADIRAKAEAAQVAGLQVIVCVGETLDERESKKALNVVLGQLHLSLPDTAASQWLSVAYEPVWAIGTGKVATDEQAQEAHAFIRGLLAEFYDAQTAAATRILYGGSVKPGNVDGLMTQPDVDGALVGGASLKADDFARIANFEAVA